MTPFLGLLSPGEKLRTSLPPSSPPHPHSHGDILCNEKLGKLSVPVLTDAPLERPVSHPQYCEILGQCFPESDG